MTYQKMVRHWCMLLLLPVCVTFTALAFDPTVQTPSLLLDEALTVYYAQMFGNDSTYAPVIIEHEAPQTLNPSVSLYLHQRQAQSGFAGLRPANALMVANEPCFVDAQWQPFTNEFRHVLPAGEGWRTVYVRTRDDVGYTQTVSDTIYLGANLPVADLANTMSDRQETVTLAGLSHPSFTQVQFSLGWLVDETYSTFQLLWGAGERVADPAAWGGGAFRLAPASGESSAWVWDYRPLLFKDRSLVAYVRLKVSDNTSPAEIARFAVGDGDQQYGPLTLRGIDFTAAGQYQEFALPFRYTGSDFLIFQFWRSGNTNTEVFVDAVTIFTAPQPLVSPLTFTVPGNNYRGQSVWVRYTDGQAFTGWSEAPVLPAQPITISPRVLMVQRDSPPPPPVVLSTPCAQPSWQVVQADPWLGSSAEQGALRLWVDPSGLPTGIHQGSITFAAPGTTFRLTVPVNLMVVDQLFSVYTPLIVR
jgi:hypothetical protein